MHIDLADVFFIFAITYGILITYIWRQIDDVRKIFIETESLQTDINESTNKMLSDIAKEMKLIKNMHTFGDK